MGFVERIISFLRGKSGKKCCAHCSRIKEYFIMAANTVYEQVARKEVAHEGPIYGGVWAQIAKQKHFYIVTGGLDKLVKVWKFDQNNLELVHTLEGHNMGVVSVAVSRDGHTIASVSMDDTLIIWDLLSGNKVREMHYTSHTFWTVTFSPNGEFLAAGGYSGKVVIIEIAKGEPMQTLHTRANKNDKFIVCVDWSPDGGWLATGSVDGVVRIFDMCRSGVLKHTISAHKEPLTKVAFSSNSKLLATSSSDGFVKVYNARYGTLKGVLDHKCWVMGVAFSKDGTRVVTGDDEGSVRIATARPMSSMIYDSDDDAVHKPVNSVHKPKVLGFDDECYMTAIEKREYLELDVLKVFKGHLRTVWCVQFSPDQNYVLSVSKDKSINIYGITRKGF